MIYSVPSLLTNNSKPMSIRLLCLCLCSLLTVSLAAQTPEENTRRYNNGQLLVKEGNYALAMEALRPLTSRSENNRYQAAASFLYGYAAYQDKQATLAKNMFLQLQSNSPDWKGMDEVQFWLARIAFDEGDYFKGYEYIGKIKKPVLKEQAETMKDTYLHYLGDLEIIDSLYTIDDGSSILGRKLADYIITQPLDSQNTSRLNRLIVKHALDPNAYNLITEERSTRKEKYTVAAVLPFQLEPGLFSPRKNFTTEMYEGMRLAAEDLAEKDIQIDLLAFDTQRDSLTTSQLCQTESLQNSDLIIGPLFPEPSEVMLDFAYRQKVNIINPLSDNATIIGSNPYSFLANAVAERKAKAFADFASASFQNPNAVIIYGDAARDSVLAHEYRKHIEADSFNVVWMEHIPYKDARRLFQKLTKEVVEDTLLIAPDSLGHVFVASTNRLLAAAAISGLDARPDTIPLLGHMEWMDIPSLRFEQLDRLAAFLLSSNHIDRSKEQYNDFVTAYLEKYEEYPSIYAAIGYDLMYFAGSMLHRHGVYFQAALQNQDEKIPGMLSRYFDYRNSNDNGCLEFFELVDAELVTVAPGEEIFEDKRPKPEEPETSEDDGDQE